LFFTALSQIFIQIFIQHFTVDHRIDQEYISLTFCFKKQVKLKPAVTGSPGQRDSILESVPENVSC